jgi:Fe-Mn family superoxide dismutase
MTNEFPELGYEYNALEPHIDEQTMKIHHTKHHRAYFDNFMKAIQGTGLEEKDAEEIIANLNSVPQDIQGAVRNNGGGFVNHKFFWQILKKNVEAKGEVVDAIKEKFGSLEKFKEEFSKAGATRFGSGWAWLVVNNGELEIMSTPNQDSPLSEGKTPILGLDVWEHAYYLKYQNKRPEYIENFFSVINWEKVNELYQKAKQ